jgi:hypothetical protein
MPILQAQREHAHIGMGHWVANLNESEKIG